MFGIGKNYQWVNCALSCVIKKDLTFSCVLIRAVLENYKEARFWFCFWFVAVQAQGRKYSPQGAEPCNQASLPKTSFSFSRRRWTFPIHLPYRALLWRRQSVRRGVKAKLTQKRCLWRLRAGIWEEQVTLSWVESSDSYSQRKWRRPLRQAAAPPRTVGCSTEKCWQIWPC